METSTLFYFLIALLYHFKLDLAEDSSLSMNVSIRSKIVYTKTDAHENLLTTYSSSLSTDFNYIPRSTTYWPLIPSVITNAFRLTDSNCFCSYDRVSNLLSCSPSLQNATSYPVSDTNFPLINVTLDDCMFSSNHFSVPNIGRKNIDQLRIYDANRNDYLVLDGTSFSSYSIKSNELLLYYFRK